MAQLLRLVSLFADITLQNSEGKSAMSDKEHWDFYLSMWKMRDSMDRKLFENQKDLNAKAVKLKKKDT